MDEEVCYSLLVITFALRNFTLLLVSEVKYVIGVEFFFFFIPINVLIYLMTNIKLRVLLLLGSKDLELNI